MQSARPTPSSGRDTPWSSTAHGKTPALPRCPTPQPPRSTLGSCAPRHSGDPWGTPGALEHPAATAGACAAAWARVGPRLCWAGRGAACWCYTAGAASGCPAPPLCSVRSPPPWGARFGVLPGCPRAPGGSCARRGVGRASCSGAMCGVRRGTAPSVPAAKAGAGWRRRAREWAPPQFQPQTIARSSWNDVSPPPVRSASSRLADSSRMLSHFRLGMIFMKFFCGEMVLLVMFHAPAYFVLLSNFVYRD